MRIQDLRHEQRGRRRRVAATVIWEDCSRPTRDLFYEVDEAFASDLMPHPHAFLVACIVPALRHGEKRIAIDEAICPELRTGLRVNMGWLRHWSGGRYTLAKIEAKTDTRMPVPRTTERVGSFLSGGVDSLALLRENRLKFPAGHPRSIRDGIIVHGFDMGGVERTGSETEAYEKAVGSLAAIAADAQVELIPILTNVRHFDDDLTCWMNEFAGAAMASVAHAISNRLSCVYIGSQLRYSKCDAKYRRSPVVGQQLWQCRSSGSARRGATLAARQGQTAG